MAVQIICNQTGIEFDAESKRTKVHPQISAMLNDLYKNGKPGAYAVATKALAAVKALDAKPEIETVLAQIEFLVEQHNGEVSAETRRRREEAERREEARRQWFLANAKVKRAGYRWQRFDGEIEDAHHPHLSYQSAAEWTLIAPDGREVTLEQALQEIK